MSVSSSLDAKAEASTLKFLGFDKEGKAAPYTLRVKNAQAAVDLAEAIKKELA